MTVIGRRLCEVVALLSHSRESLSREEGGMEMGLKPSVPNLGSAGRFTVAAFAISALLWAASASADSIEGQVLGGRRTDRKIDSDAVVRECGRAQAIGSNSNRRRRPIYFERRTDRLTASSI